MAEATAIRAQGVGTVGRRPSASKAALVTVANAPEPSPRNSGTKGSSEAVENSG